ncbi:MAG TPA: biotin--[acetyl-CoA-carboxylase] ligase [Fluviicola sp.]|nr:biotin--[acetyl-CoA-carboxylase] ligase [Fluviicola sp.]
MVGKQIIHLPEVDSTNNYVAKLISAGKCTHGTVILADMQTSGKGQRGNVWQPNQGTQFTASYYLDTAFLSVDKLCYFNMSVALAVKEAISNFVSPEVKIKWPNDLFVIDKKNAGILIEAQWKEGKLKGAIVGIGVNLQQVEAVEHAISIQELSGEIVSNIQFLDKLSLILTEYFQFLKSYEFMKIKTLYESSMWKKDEIIFMKNRSDDQVFEGVIRGIDAQGDLQVEKGGSLAVYRNQELDFSLNYARKEK